MSKVTLTIFLVAVAVLVIALLTRSTALGGGSGVVMLVGLIYSYVVTLRDLERRDREDQMPPGV